MKIRDLIILFTCLTGTLSFISVYFNTEIPVKIFFILSLLNLYFNIVKLKRWILTVLTVGVTIFYVSQMSLSNLVLPLLNMLTLLLGIKFLELKLYRDHMQVTAISLFLFAGSGLVNLGISFFVYASVLLFLITFQLSSLSFYEYEETEISSSVVKTLFKRILFIPIFSLPVSVIFFMLLPRTDYPMLDILNNNSKGQTGFSEGLSLGDVKDIQQDNRVAFRVKMKKVPDSWLYFRGIVFDIYRDGSWSSSADKNPLKKLQHSETVNFEIFMEPTGSKYLITPDKTFSLSLRNSKINGRFEVTVSSNINKKIRYRGKFSPGFSFEDTVSDISPYIRADVSKTLEDYAGKMPEINTKDSILLIENFFKSGDFQYSLTELPTGKNSLERFLFENKKGNCEFFASAMAVILRLKGVPARLVGGYKGGIYNDVDGGYYAVSYKNAHVWVEAFMDGKWYRFDPTPASMDIFTGKSISPVKLKWRLFADRIFYFWNIFVINYDFEKQINVLKKFRNVSSLNRTLHYKYLFLFAVVVTAVLFSIFRVKRKTPEELLLNRFRKRVVNILGNRLKYVDNQETLHSIILKIKDENLKNESLDILYAIYKSFYKDRAMTSDIFSDINKRIKNLTPFMGK